jgi:amino acid adenylation domain-containing protein
VTARKAARLVRADEATVCDMLLALADDDPGRVALRAAGREWTRGELATAVGEAALALRERGVRPGDTVVLQAQRSAGSVIATLAVLRAGAAVAPLGEWSAASARIRAAIVDLAPRLTIADEPDVPSATPLSAVTGFAEAHADEPGPLPSTDDLAYILHTSGTSGRPKAVPVPHRALADRLTWGQRLYPLGADDVVLHWAAPIFDFALWEMLAPLCFGATLVVAPEDAAAEPALLGKILKAERVTCVHFVPSLLDEFIASGEAGSLGGVRYVFSGGEALPAELARDLLQTTRARVFNQYGPTEACIDCTAWEIAASDLEGSSVPVGHPQGGTRARVLDEKLREVPDGEIGMLYLGGTCLAWGYHGAGGQTAAAFVPDPSASVSGARLYRTGDRVRRGADGVLEFIGRDDRQVKIRGIRIELGEVEAALRRHPGIRQAAVIATVDEARATQIAAHLVAGARPPAPAEIRRFLTQWLLPAAIPDKYAFHPELPRTTTGKLDWQALAGLTAAAPGAQAELAREATETEQRLIALWTELMKVHRVGLTDDFFDIGGHSLLAMKMLARIWAAFHVRLPARVIFDAPTIASLAVAVDRAVAEAAAADR